VLLAGCSGPQPSISESDTAQQGTAATLIAPHWQALGITRPVCSQIVGKPTCLALTQKGIQPECVGAQCGWAPADLQTHYKLPISKGSGQIVAVVDAGDNPNAATDIATYRNQFDLGTASFYKYNQEGQQDNYPSYTGWSVEIDLDIEMVSATCPKCTIYLVEANSSASTDLDAAEKEAVTLGAHIVCYGSVSCLDKSDFDKKGVTYLGAGGDSGSNETGPPAAFDSVAAIGGTQLMKNGSQYSEVVSGSSGGCATGVARPKWQRDTFCAYRLANDAAAEAGCSPGVAEYDSYDGAWFGVCGTSVPAPLLAGVFGLAGNAANQDGGRTFWQRAHRKYLYPIPEGHDGECGYQHGHYNTCAGWGSPDGIGAF
jgi:subtilase family serine protease